MFKKVLFLTPRVLSGLITLFFLAFTLEGLDNLADGLMHLLFALPFVLITIWAWKKPRDGGIIFMLIGGLLLVFIHEEWASVITWTVIFATGLLFYLSNKKSRGKR